VLYVLLCAGSSWLPRRRLPRSALGAWGASESFVILGAFMVLLCVPLALITRRAARSAALQRPKPTLADW